jgi:hypothetical protein
MSIIISSWPASTKYGGREGKQDAWKASGGVCGARWEERRARGRDARSWNCAPCAFRGLRPICVPPATHYHVGPPSPCLEKPGGGGRYGTERRLTARPGQGPRTSVQAPRTVTASTQSSDSVRVARVTWTRGSCSVTLSRRYESRTDGGGPGHGMDMARRNARTWYLRKDGTVPVASVHGRRWPGTCTCWWWSHWF